MQHYIGIIHFLIKIYWLWYCAKDNKIDWGWSPRSSGQ